MEAAPPTYEKAVQVNAWDVVARSGFIASRDLCSAALVCGAWHAIFVPHLWGNPAAHFGTENDRVYVALTRFKRTLPWARLYTRSFTHTLHLPPAHAEIYNGPHADWLREVLDRLPNLQSLVVRGLPFFDHAALVALKYRPPEEKQETDENGADHHHAVELPAQVPLQALAFQRPRPLPGHVPTFGLRLLDASRCTNTTATGLCEALKRLDQLIYLDLSYTYAARDRGVFDVLRSFSGLQVLKLRGIYLRDVDLDILAPAISNRVRNLDVRNNHLSDRSVRALLDSCFIKERRESGIDGGFISRTRSPALLQYLGSEMLDIYQGEAFEQYLRKSLTTSFISRLAIEDAPEGGITHLYLTGNRFSVEGLSGLIRSQRLHVFDATVDTKFFSTSSPTSRKDSGVVQWPGAEKLASILTGCAGENVRYLRISHELVTKRSPKQDEETMISGRVELDAVPSPPIAQAIAELSGTAQVFELPGESLVRHELPGESMPMVTTPIAARPRQLTIKEEEAMKRAHRGSVYAPEPVTGTVESSLPRTDTAGSSTTVSSLTPDWISGATTTVASPSLGTSGHNVTGRPRTLSYVKQERQARARYLQQSDGFHPGSAPHLRTLVLANFPAFSESEEAADRVIAFITECAEETALARKQASSDYTLPPGGREAANALRNAAKNVFALEDIVLEVVLDGPKHNKAGSQWRHQSSRSMTNDRDSEALWSASGTDFSFFDDNEETVFPTLEPPGRSMFMQAMSEKEMVTNLSQTSINSSSKVNSKARPVLIDNIERISRFRKAKKAEYQARLDRGEINPEVNGFWPGAVKVVRLTGNHDPFAQADESLDYFGNSFSKGYLYK